MSTWYLVRHGETEWNRTGRMQGHTGVPLSAEGRRQATLVAERLRSVEFAAVYCSDLPRAAETARIIAAGRDLAISDEADLREFSYGEWEGLTLEEVETRYPGALAERIEAGGNLGWTAPGGESAVDAIQRVRRFSRRASASLADWREHPGRGARRIFEGPCGLPAGFGGRRFLEVPGRQHRCGDRLRSRRQPRAGVLERHEPSRGRRFGRCLVSRRLTLVLGGVRAGKSRYAQELAQGGGRVLYVATAEAGDDEMAARIQAHRDERPSDWATVEEPIDVVGALEPLLVDFDTVLIDCLTLWVSNLLLQDPDDGELPAHIQTQARNLIVPSTGGAVLPGSSSVTRSGLASYRQANLDATMRMRWGGSTNSSRRRRTT